MSEDAILRSGTHQIPLDEIYAEDQDRQHFSTPKLEELAAAMQALGQAQAIMVRPKPGERGKYVIVFGEAGYERRVIWAGQLSALK